MYTSIGNIFAPISGVCNVSQVEIIDDNIYFSDYLPVVCSLHSNDYYCVYTWSDLAKQKYYYSTGSALQAFIESLPQYESSLSGHKYVDVLYTHLIDVLKENSAVHCKRFVNKSHNTVRRTQRLEYLKCASRDA